MVQSIQTFVSDLIAVYRPNKKTYSILKFSTENRWKRYLLDPDIHITLWRQIINPAPVKISIDASNRFIDCIGRGIYLKYGEKIVPVIRKLAGSTKNFPNSFYAGEITVTGQQNETVPGPPLWRLYPVQPIPQVVPNPTVVKHSFLPIPKQIAWIIAEDASKNNQDCPITLNTISPITASITNCFHLFETHAIVQALNNKPSCPVCRHQNPTLTLCFTE